MSSAADYSAMADFLVGQKAHGAKFGIDRMRVLAEALGHPERRTPCLHVAGTNGKGSVAAMIEAILRTAGWRTGLYTSPHLVDIGERVQVNRRSLTPTEIVAYMRELQPVADRLTKSDPDDRPSFFEYLTAMAFLQFARTACDMAVIEVGLGGRLDATNIVTPEVSVITSIGLDHCEILGSQLEQIAAEKAGIVKAGVPVVIGRMPRAAEKIIRAVAAQVGAPVDSVAETYGEDAAALPTTKLEGEYQRWNAATATLAVRKLGARWRADEVAIRRGLAAVEWPGRWQRTTVGSRRVILDASHNPDGAIVLKSNLSQLVAETGSRPIVVVGVLGQERARPLLDTICSYARELRLVMPNDPRACTFEQLERLVPADFKGPVIRSRVEDLFPTANQCLVGEPDEVVVVTGSIYLLGEVLGRLRR